MRVPISMLACRTLRAASSQAPPGERPAVAQLSSRAAIRRCSRVEHVGFPERKLEGLQATGILVEQVPQIRRRTLLIGYRQKYGRTAIMPGRRIELLALQQVSGR
jgi:hypothetical protein